jgi:hypothetical protein
MDILELKKLRQKCTMAVFDAGYLKLNNYYEVILSDKSTQICKFIQIIDDLPVFKTINNRYLYYDGGLNQFPNRYIGWKEIEHQTIHKREDILSNLLK